MRTMLSYRHLAIPAAVLLAAAVACAPAPAATTPVPTTGAGVTGTPMAAATPTRAAALVTPAPGTPTVVAGAATTPEMQLAINYMQLVQSQLQQLQGAVAGAQPVDTARLSSLLAAMLGRFSDLMTQLDAAMPQLTPEERAGVDASMRRMQQRIESTRRSLGVTAAPTVVTTPGPLTFTQLAQDLSQLQQTVLQQGVQLSPTQQQEVIMQASGLASDAADLLGKMTPALSRVSSDQQQRIVNTIAEINTLAQQMLIAAGQPAPTATPVPVP